LTLAEYAVLCLPCDDKGPAGGRAMTEAEVQAESARWRRMTNRERLLHAKNGA
jgi:hypothetical protein